MLQSSVWQDKQTILPLESPPIEGCSGDHTHPCASLKLPLLSSLFVFLPFPWRSVEISFQGARLGSPWWKQQPRVFLHPNIQLVCRVGLGQNTLTGVGWKSLVWFGVGQRHLGWSGLDGPLHIQWNVYPVVLWFERQEKVTAETSCLFTGGKLCRGL